MTKDGVNSENGVKLSLFSGLTPFSESNPVFFAKSSVKDKRARLLSSFADFLIFNCNRWSEHGVHNTIQVEGPPPVRRKFQRAISKMTRRDFFYGLSHLQTPPSGRTWCAQHSSDRRTSASQKKVLNALSKMTRRDPFYGTFSPADCHRQSKRGMCNEVQVEGPPPVHHKLPLAALCFLAPLP
jgi:hypothetical protein